MGGVYGAESCGRCSGLEIPRAVFIRRRPRKMGKCETAAATERPSVSAVATPETATATAETATATPETAVATADGRNGRRDSRNGATPETAAATAEKKCSCLPYMRKNKIETAIYKIEIGTNVRSSLRPTPDRVRNRNQIKFEQMSNRDRSDGAWGGVCKNCFICQKVDVHEIC